MPKTRRVTLPAPIHAAALRGEVSTLLVRMQPQPPIIGDNGGPFREVARNGRGFDFRFQMDNPKYVACPYAPGDLIACREPHGSHPALSRFVFRGDVYERQVEMVPSYRMPLLAVRLWFRVQAVEARRVQDVTEEEARAMGYPRIITRDGSLHQAGMKLACERAGWGIQDWAWKLKVERTER